MSRFFLFLAAFLTPILLGKLQFDTQVAGSGTQQILKAILDGSAAPSLSLLVVAILATIALLLNRQSDVPRMPRYLFVGLIAVIAVSVVFSTFQFDSAAAVVPWLVGAVALTVASSHRESAAPAGLLCGCVVVAALGIHEYIFKLHDNSSWRIFSLWFNPNALASILGLGLWIAGDVYRTSQPRLRPLPMLAGLFLLIAFVLTQSKGAFLMLAVSFAAYLAFSLSTKRMNWKQAGTWAAVVAVFVGALFYGSRAWESSRSATLMSRVTAPSAESDQSVAYRMELLKGAGQMVATRPWGYGIGTYRFVGGSIGNVMPAQQAHNAYAQLAVEASPLAPILLLIGIVASLWLALKRSTLPVEHLAAGITFLALHGAIESNLLVNGILVAGAFALGTIFSRAQVEAPTSAPVAPWLGLAACAGLAYVGIGELTQAQVRLDLAANGHPEDKCATLRRIWPGDSESWALSADSALDPHQQKLYAERAFALGPHVSNAVLVASVRRELGDREGEKQACLQGLEQDPNELDLLIGLMENPANSREEQIRWANRLVALEDSKAFTVSPLPDLVPNQPAIAHLKLAELVAAERADHLGRAMQRIHLYCQRTIPRIVAAYSAHDFSGYAGEDGRRALSTLFIGLLAAKRARQHAEETKDSGLLERAKSMESAVRDAEAKLGKVIQFKALKV